MLQCYVYTHMYSMVSTTLKMQLEENKSAKILKVIIE